MSDRRNARIRRMKSLLLFGPLCIILVLVVTCVYLVIQNASLKDRLQSVESQIVDVRDECKIRSMENDNLVESTEETATILNSLDTRVKNVEKAVASKDEDDSGYIKKPKKVYLTFDDGPSANTQKILDILDEYGVKATFFMQTANSDEQLYLYKKILDDGHTIGLHSYSHDYDEIYESKENFREDVTKISDYIYDNTGYRCLLYRFPGGSGNTSMKVSLEDCVDVLKEEGIEYCDWDIYAGDAVNPSLGVKEISENVLDSLDTINDNNEAIILMHDQFNKDTTVEALPIIIEKLIEMDIPMGAIEENTTVVHNRANTNTH